MNYRNPTWIRDLACDNLEANKKHENASNFFVSVSKRSLLVEGSCDPFSLINTGSVSLPTQFFFSLLLQ